MTRATSTPARRAEVERFESGTKLPHSEDQKPQSGEVSSHSIQAVGGLDASALRIELIQRICRLPPERLWQAAEALGELQIEKVTTAAASVAPQEVLRPKDWPHAPLHRLTEKRPTGCKFPTISSRWLSCDSSQRCTALQKSKSGTELPHSKSALEHRLMRP